MDELQAKDRLQVKVSFTIIDRGLETLASIVTDPYKERLKNSNFNGLRTNIVEDQILAQIQNGVTVTRTVLNNLEENQIFVQSEAALNEVVEFNQQINWRELFSEERESEMKRNFVDKLAGFGISQEDSSRLLLFKFNFIDTDGQYMQKTSGTVSINTQQITRKALDFVQAFQGYELEDVLRALVICTSGHELGHEIDQLFPRAVNNIPASQGWGGEGIYSLECKKERFAEYWGRSAINNKHLEEIVELEWALQVAKVNQLWTVVDNWNKSHQKKVNLMEIFYEIKNRTKSKYPLTHRLITIREAGYFDAAIENYALPYEETIVKSAFKKDQEVNQ